jgi:hypothetical protein
MFGVETIGKVRLALSKGESIHMLGLFSLPIDTLKGRQRHANGRDSLFEEPFREDGRCGFV